MAEHAELKAVPRRIFFDGATVFGFIAAALLIVSAILIGDTPGAFINIPSLLIVVGGTFAITATCFNLTDIGRTFAVLGSTVFYRGRDASQAATTMLDLAEFCRKKGVLPLQGELVDRFMREPFLHKALNMVVDGMTEKEIAGILAQDQTATASRAHRAVSVLRRAADISPAMGLIGTLVGLVQMLTNLDNPSVIGPAMAVALLTTFYGVVLAHMVFNPLASKIERNIVDDQLIYHIYSVGALAIARKDNPRRLEMLLNSALPPESKVRYFV